MQLNAVRFGQSHAGKSMQSDAVKYKSSEFYSKNRFSIVFKENLMEVKMNLMVERENRKQERG